MGGRIGILLLVPFLIVITAGVGAHEDVEIGVPMIVHPTKTEGVDSSFRLRVPGYSRLPNLWKFAHTFHLSIRHAGLLTAKFEVCFHRNGSLPLGHCAKESWRPVDKKDGWTDVTSPFETTYLDVRRSGLFYASSSLNITVTEEAKLYRYVFLGAGMAVLAIAPVVSSWVPFYYSSGITLGIILVVLVLLFQVMKLLPTGRRSSLYVAMYGTLAGLGTIILSYMYRWASALLLQLGYSEELINPLVYLMAAGIAILGAALGFFFVRKFVLSTEGEIDPGTAQFVKWALRLVGAVMITQSTHDPLMALLLLLFGAFVSWGFGFTPFLLSIIGPSLSALPLPPWPESVARDISYFSPSKSKSPVKHSPVKVLKDLPTKRSSKKQQPVAEASPQSVQPRSKSEVRLGKFTPSSESAKPLVRSPAEERSPLPKFSPSTPLYSRPASSPFSQLSPPLFSTAAGASLDPGFYSTFHNMPDRKPVSKEEYKQMSVDYTREEVRKLLSSEEFQEWVLQHADRLGAIPNEARQERSESEIQKTATMESEDESHGFLGRLIRR